jgi:hypothetical protein
VVREEIGLKTKGTHMSADGKPDKPQIHEDAFSNINIISLALPWLNFQLQILEIAKQCIEARQQVLRTLLTTKTS